MYKELLFAIFVTAIVADLASINQKYSNYHIVLVDDASNDKTVQAIKNYTKENNFQNITFIQNTERKFTSYNLKNTVENYCQ